MLCLGVPRLHQSGAEHAAQEAEKNSPILAARLSFRFLPAPTSLVTAECEKCPRFGMDWISITLIRSRSEALFSCRDQIARQSA